MGVEYVFPFKGIDQVSLLKSTITAASFISVFGSRHGQNKSISNRFSFLIRSEPSNYISVFWDMTQVGAKWH